MEEAVRHSAWLKMTPRQATLVTSMVKGFALVTGILATDVKFTVSQGMTRAQVIHATPRRDKKPV
jgi:uncharacterized membrane protein